MSTVETKETLRWIDCDAHFTEPPDLWTSRGPASLRDRLPVQRTTNGFTGWYMEGIPWATIGGNTIRRGGVKDRGAIKVRGGAVSVQPFDLVDPASYSVKERLELMDSIGIDTQIIYPNGIGFTSNNLFGIDDMELRKATLQIYNDFLVDIQEESKRRLLPQAMVPIWDMDFTIQEVKRLLDRGITGFTLTDKPEQLHLPELNEPYFEPMWDLFNEAGAVANFHVGAGGLREDDSGLRRWMEAAPGGDQAMKEIGPPRTYSTAWKSLSGPETRDCVASCMNFIGNSHIIANLCFSSLFDRFPRLKIVSAESGIGWVPFFLETMDWEFREAVSDPFELSQQKRLPSEYFHDHIYVTFWFERMAPRLLLEQIGVENVLIETDVPHPTCLYPATREYFEKSLEHLDPDTRRRIVQDNAAGLYGIQV